MALEVQMLFLGEQQCPYKLNPSKVTGIIHVHKTVPPGTMTLVFSSAGKSLTLLSFMAYIFKDLQTVYVNNCES